MIPPPQVPAAPYPGAFARAAYVQPMRRLVNEVRAAFADSSTKPFQGSGRAFRQNLEKLLEVPNRGTAGFRSLVQMEEARRAAEREAERQKLARLAAERAAAEAERKRKVAEQERKEEEERAARWQRRYEATQARVEEARESLANDSPPSPEQEQCGNCRMGGDPMGCLCGTGAHGGGDCVVQ